MGLQLPAFLSFDEVAAEMSRREGKKLKPFSVRRTHDRALKKIKPLLLELIKEQYGASSNQKLRRRTRKKNSKRCH